MEIKNIKKITKDGKDLVQYEEETIQERTEEWVDRQIQIRQDRIKRFQDEVTRLNKYKDVFNDGKNK